MLKKLLYILLLSLAFGIVMAHDIIPHHHDHETDEAVHHHHDGAGHHHDHDDDGEQEKGLSHVFEFFYHSGATLQFISFQLSFHKLFSALDFAFHTPACFDVLPCESPHAPFGFSPQKNFYSFLYSPQTSLRAPPVV